jgi:hypothetical protein
LVIFLCVFAWIILHWSWDRTVVFFSHPPILSRLSPFRRYRSSHLWRLRKLPRIGVLQRIRRYSFCPSILKRGIPIIGFVFPTIVPRRLAVRFLLLWYHGGYCPCVGCVLCTTLPLLFPALEMIRFLPLFDGIGFWLCWSMRLILWFV